MILSVPFCPYHFVRDILSATILSYRAGRGLRGSYGGRGVEDPRSTTSREEDSAVWTALIPPSDSRNTAAVAVLGYFVLYCIVLYSSIYIAPLNDHRQTEALLVRLAQRKETGFKK